jgi:hypothetical protein
MTAPQGHGSVPSGPLHRIVRILDRLSGINAQMALAGWSAALGVEAGNDRELQVEVVRAMALFNDEIDRAYASITGTEFRPEDYDGAFVNLRDATTLARLYTSDWNTIRNMLPAPVLGVLRMCSRYVAPSEYVMSEQEIQELREAMAALAKAVDELPPHDPLARFLGEQYDRMARAIREYEIAGADALRHRMYELEGALRNQFAQATPEERHRPAVVAASKVLTTAKKILAGISLVGGALKASQEIVHVLADAPTYYLAPGSPIEDDQLDTDYTIDEDLASDSMSVSDRAVGSVDTMAPTPPKK